MTDQSPEETEHTENNQMNCHNCGLSSMLVSIIEYQTDEGEVPLCSHCHDEYDNEDKIIN